MLSSNLCGALTGQHLYLSVKVTIIVLINFNMQHILISCGKLNNTFIRDMTYPITFNYFVSKKSWNIF